MDFHDIKIDFLGHSGFVIVTQTGLRIAIDPLNITSGLPPADIILVTHSHYDHCSIKDISALSRKGTIIVAPADSQSKITRVDGIEMQVIEVGDELNLGKIKIEAFPAYNLGKEFHPKKEGWIGYVIKMGNTIIYHAGDTDNIPEMQKLTGYGKEGNHFLVLLPVSGTYVMNSEEAAEAASIIRPEIAIPMHYGSGVAGSNEDAQRFVEICNQKGLSAKILEKI